jgi:uncharacterized oxidoreductase
MKLQGNHILITGGTSGIGAALAEAFLQRGSEVAICGRRSARLSEMQRLHPNLKTCECDISTDSGRRALLAWAQKEFSRVNILVNNAGIQRDIQFFSGLEEYSSGENEIQVNLAAPVELTGLFVPLLRRNPNPALFYVSSGLGFVPAARMPVYSATKAAVHAFSLAIRHQLKKAGVQVVEIVPPAVDTELNPEGRAARGNFKANLTAQDFVAGVLKEIEAGGLEVGFGPSSRWIRSSREELEQAFQQMNSRWE